jgi:hypothetical protein
MSSICNSAPAAQDAGRLRAADRLAARKDDEVGAGRHDALEVRARRQFAGGIDQHRQAARMGVLDELCQRRRAVGVVHIENPRRLRAERRLELPRLRAANAGAGDNFIEAYLHEARPRGADGMIVAVAMLARHHELMRKVLGVRQLLHTAQVVACQDRCRAEHEPRRRAAGDDARLGAGRLGDDARRCTLQLIERYGILRGGTKRVEHRLRHRRSPQSRHRSGHVDDRLDAPLAKDAHAIHPFATTRKVVERNSFRSNGLKSVLLRGH